MGGIRSSGFDDQSIATGDVDVVVDEINAKVLELQETGGTLVADGTEQDVYIVNAPTAELKPIVTFINLDNMQVGDATFIRVYYRIASGGAWLLSDFQGFANADGGLTNGKVLIAIDLWPIRYGVRVTLEQTAGANRNYLHQTMYEAN